MKEKIAFLFPGQGSQAAGMGKELAALYPVARQTFDEANAALGYNLSQLCFEGPEEKLRLTEITQPAILTVSVAAQRVLREKGISPKFSAPRCPRNRRTQLRRSCRYINRGLLRCRQSSAAIAVAGHESRA